jgi:FtsP/CotA-like multicopper oxidase with cupredoxin domain
MLGTTISPQMRLLSRGYRPHFHDLIIEIPSETLVPLLSMERVAILADLQILTSPWSTSHGANGQSFHVQLTDSPESTETWHTISYRFRLVSISCDPNFTFSIDSHEMTVIEVDGNNVEPLVVDSIQIFAGKPSPSYSRTLLTLTVK